jgi:hypothetical protein
VIAADVLATRFARVARDLGRDAAEPARVAMLLAAGVDVAQLDDLYRHGDNEERRAILRALPLLDEPWRFVALAIEACRTSVVPIFEAIACENPYPALHFPADNFNQLVLKALFIGVSLERVVGLRTRLSPELTRMGNDYAAERRAAGRSVPADLTLIGSQP